MNETTDKIANKLLESIQKSQSTAEQSSKPAEPTLPTAKPKERQTVSKTNKTKANETKARETKARETKALETNVSKTDSETPINFESNRQLRGGLRWPD